MLKLNCGLPWSRPVAKAAHRVQPCSLTRITAPIFQLKKNESMETQLQTCDSDPRKHLKQGEDQDVLGLWADLGAVLDPVALGCRWTQTLPGC